MGDNLKIRVNCYSGYRGEETPQRFFIGERRVEVDEVLDRWLSPGERYFKVRGDDSAIYILRHDPRSDTWEMTLYDSGKREGDRLSST